MNRLAVALCVCLLQLSVAGCASRGNEEPVVENVKLRTGEKKPGADGGNVPTVTAEITLNKDALFGQEFLYGADLQHSTWYDAEYELTLQAIAVGHIPARFRVAGTSAGRELQLVADNRIYWKSDVNHPERLLSRFPVLAETETTLTVSAARSEITLSQMFQGDENEGSLVNAKAPLPRDHWVRSVEFDPNGNYLLQETSVMLADGTIAEFLESIFPRSNLKPSAGFDPIRMDPENPAGGDEGLPARYRFLRGQTTHRGEESLGFAQRFDIHAGKDVDWYVTANAPDEYLPAIRAGIEGWNRYFREFDGIKRDVMHFKGRLPGNVKLGDPRYNVILWDSRLEAGAAYESQASDPETGKQSHSLIYLPAMWAKAGRDYWKAGQFSDPKARSRKPVARNAFARACLHDLSHGLSNLVSARLSSEEELSVFGRRLLAQTLYHEVGHALGLDHNFKGSLSLDRSDPKSPATVSVMDYNDYEAERFVFDRVDANDGPILEYDRQALSALYNQMKDVSEDDEDLAACNDAEADSEEDGIDPLCVRYDLELDPTESIRTAWSRLHEETLPSDVTAAQAVGRVVPFLYPPTEIARIGKEEEFKKATKALAAAIKASIRFHTHSGRTSFFQTAMLHSRVLLVHAEDVLPEGYEADSMRELVYSMIAEGVKLARLPATLAAAAKKAESDAVAALKTTPYAQSLSVSKLAAAAKDAEKAIADAIESIEKDAQTGLPAARAALLGTLARNEKVPYYFGVTGTGAADYEAALIGLATEAVRASTGRTPAERLAGATALATYKGRPGADAAIASLVSEITVERVTAKTNAERELVEKLLKALK